EGHVACQNERDRTSEQPEHDEHPADELNHAVDARERHGGHSRRGRNWQAKIFRHPMLQEQQADHDAQDTQHTWGPRCEKAVDRRHHNFSYERPEACQTPVMKRARTSLRFCSVSTLVITTRTVSRRMARTSLARATTRIFPCSMASTPNGASAQPTST